jgi:hypothetical protein
MATYTVAMSPEAGFISIYRHESVTAVQRHGKEVLYWDHTEWEEDPDLIFTIVEAVRIALKQPDEMDAKLREMKYRRKR